MINKNLSKISEFGIWLIQWFGDFSKDIKVLQIRTLNSIIRFLVAPLKSLILNKNRAFLFSVTYKNNQTLRTNINIQPCLCPNKMN